MWKTDIPPRIMNDNKRLSIFESLHNVIYQTLNLFAVQNVTIEGVKTPGVGVGGGEACHPPVGIPHKFFPKFRQSVFLPHGYTKSIAVDRSKGSGTRLFSLLIGR